ncbi:MAG: sulfite reductase flavoprotein subunit alpha [Acidobacteriaceae bacterium]
MSIPFIPEDAPFTPEQRVWLNGFLAGLFSKAPHSTTSAAPFLRIGVYFATQSGTAERLAKKMAKELKAQGHTADLLSLDKLSPVDLHTYKHGLFFASTYGEGDPPESVMTFRDALLEDNAPKLSSLRFAVFCLGDRTYEHFCKFGIELDERLAALGGSRMRERVESDIEVDEPFVIWKDDILPRLATTPNEAAVEVSGNVTAPSHSIVVQKYTRENPLHATLLERNALTSENSSKLTMHLSFGVDDPEFTYEAGDACGVVPTNNMDLIQEILSALPFDGGVEVEIPKHGTVSLEEAFLHHLQPTRLTRKMVHAFAEKAQCKTLSALLPQEQSAALESFTYDRWLIDLLNDYPGVITDPQELVAMLPRLTPRLYSISSSPAAHGREVHCTIAVVRYRSHNRERGGIASTMLMDRVAVGDSVPIYIQPNKRFRLPTDRNLPVIMIGPGTGIAPFRSFLHERQALGHQGNNWLFFGERSAQTDFLYCRELKEMTESGHLTRLDTAFSRDQAHKVYVQDRMLEHGAELWRWLNDGAQLFVCGDASRMAKDVDSALHKVIEQHGRLSFFAAQEYVSQLLDDRRYHRDVY